MFLIICVILFISPTILGKQSTKVGASTTEKITKFLDDVTEFLTDVLYSISTFIGLEKKSGPAILNSSDANGAWGLENVMKYTLSTVKSGYKLLKGTIPVVQMARASVQSVALVLPNVTLATFVEHFVNNITPELVKNYK